MADLRSRAFARVLDLVSEGEIGGLVDGYKSVYLDGTPIQNQDGTYNFEEYFVESRPGTNDQEYIAGIPAVESETSVGLEVTKAIPLVRTVSNANVNSVRIRIRLNSLVYQKTDGSLDGATVEMKLELQSGGGSYVDVPLSGLKFTGKTTNKYERTVLVPLTGSAPWNIRLSRITGDTTDIRLSDKTFWESYTEIIDAKLRYPNAALVHVKFNSQYFQGIPTRAYDVKLLKVKVPSNYDPETRTYSGIWDGTFKTEKEWTDNPAWCFYDLLTTPRYGLGGYINADQVDKWSLYTIARYCDELVDDGFGGTEPRFTCNLYMQSRREAFNVIQDLSSIFRGMVYWSAGQIAASQDAPGDPVALFTPSNVVDGAFTYQGSSSKARHTIAMVTWNDPEDEYLQKVEYVEDADGIARYGVVETEVTAIGCTSRGQANRVGRWMLYSEQSETETVQFKAGLEGAVCRPGQIIAVSDPVRGGTRRGGRIVSATLSTITIDSPVSISGGGHSISVLLPDGTIEKREVASITGVSITLVTDLSDIPNDGAIWMLESPNLKAQLFRVISMSEADDKFEITALAHNPDKFDLIENGLVLQPREISLLTLRPQAPSNLTVTESLYETSAEVRVLVSLAWNTVETASSYRVSYRIDEGNYISVPETSSNTIDIRDAAAGRYSFRVQAVNSLGGVGETAEIVRDIAGKTAPPAQVQGFSLVPLAGSAYLTWQKSTDLDVLVGGTVRIRHTPDTTDQAWNNAIDILPAMSGNQTSANAPLLAGTYMAKFVDSSGFSSIEPTLIVTTVPEAIALNVVETVNESAFPGTFDGTVYSDTVDGLTLGSADLVDDRTDLVDTWEVIDVLGGVSPYGTYYFADGVDLGAVYPSRITARIRATGYDTGEIWDFKSSDIDEWLDIDGSRADSANAALYMRTTNNNPAGTPTWTEWKPFFASQYTARGYEFKMVLTSGDPSHNISITELQVSIDMEDRVAGLDNIVSGAGTYSVTYSEPFWVTPSIGITAEAMNSGDFYTITNKTAAGFDIIFKNSAGTAISRTFDVMAKGYGRRVTI